ncbi:hypothetical protein EDC04DRAFT_2220199 [Pisolithus marmoratus]|nr:hypothetical protein EDC04DRAFT_2220199 [Pisolithus marmoratus]
MTTCTTSEREKACSYGSRLSHGCTTSPFQPSAENWPAGCEHASVVERHPVGDRFADQNNVDGRHELDNDRSKHDRSEHHPHDGPYVRVECALHPSAQSVAPSLEPKPDAEVKVIPPRASTPSPSAAMQPSSIARMSLQTLNSSRLEQAPSVDRLFSLYVAQAFPTHTKHPTHVDPFPLTSHLLVETCLPAHPRGQTHSPFFA